MNILRRIKNLWEWSRYKPNIKVAIEETKRKGQVLADQNILLTLEEDIPKGNGKAEWIGEGDEEELREQEREDKGFKGIFGL